MIYVKYKQSKQWLNHSLNHVPQPWFWIKDTILRIKGPQLVLCLQVTDFTTWENP